MTCPQQAPNQRWHASTHTHKHTNKQKHTHMYAYTPCRTTEWNFNQSTGNSSRWNVRRNVLPIFLRWELRKKTEHQSNRTSTPDIPMTSFMDIRHHDVPRVRCLRHEFNERWRVASRKEQRHMNFTRQPWPWVTAYVDDWLADDFVVVCFGRLSRRSIDHIDKVRGADGMDGYFYGPPSWGFIWIS